MIIWLASYPKSGNTWLRSILAALIYSKDGEFNFKLLDQIPQFPRRKYFNPFTINYNDIDEIKKYWISAQERINLNSKINFFKTHQLNCNIKNFAFTDNKNTAAVIYIVRDPRALVNSISNHYSKSFEDSKNFILTSRIINIRPKNLDDGNVATLIGTWSEHYRFWTKTKLFHQNILILRYEDLIKDIEKQLNQIINFLKRYLTFEINEKKKKNIINSTSFINLKKLEDEGTFRENVYNELTKKKVKFFFKGPDNDWSTVLPKEIKKKLEITLENEMKELKYL